MLRLSGERILLIGFFLTPFTALRFGFFGLGEILILTAFLISIFTGNFGFKIDSRIKIFYQFWSIFLIISLFGLYFNNFFLYKPSSTFVQMLFDLFSYIFILITVITVGHYGANQPNFSQTFFKKLFIYWGFIFVILFAISFYTPVIFGLPLRYHEYFSPLVENVHQAAMVTSAMTYIMLFLSIKSNNLYSKLLFLITSILFCIMAITSGSTKAILGIVLGTIMSILIVLTYRNTGRYKIYINVASFFISTALLLTIISLYSNEITFLAIQFFTESDGSGARGVLYKDGLIHGLNSPLVGHGPGAHVPYKNRFWDAHNSTLTIFLQSGILGVLLYVWFNIKMIFKVTINFALFGAITAIGMYILGGDVLRRLPIWIMLLGLCYFSINSSRNSSIQ